MRPQLLVDEDLQCNAEERPHVAMLAIRLPGRVEHMTNIPVAAWFFIGEIWGLWECIDFGKNIFGLGSKIA